ncbi:MAG: pantetheine-phosphate adenylyltransferase [Clostridia bacterium]|nr:pantetheine-phosphate adenylyltransferase [Clostridiales bacterium]MCR5803990.1 pantetheine-phosphate adenylyltransferase [Clostridia bacterium]
MSILLFPGSFDPFTMGHCDIAKRASKLCDKLVVAVMDNSAKHPAFSTEDRVNMARESLKEYKNIEVVSSGGLLVDLFKELGCSAVVRGIRSESDFRYEAEMAMANRLLYADYEVLLLPCRENLSMTSSTIVKEVCYYGGDISKMVPAQIVDFVTKELKKGRS